MLLMKYIIISLGFRIINTGFINLSNLNTNFCVLILCLNRTEKSSDPKKKLQLLCERNKQGLAVCVFETLEI